MTHLNPQITHPALSVYMTCRTAAEAISFYERAFGARVLRKLAGPDGRYVHVSMEINGALIMLMDEMPEYGAHSPLALNGTSVSIHLNVPDVDALFARAVAAGASVVMPVTDMFWGDRYGALKDPFGHSWSLATPGPKLLNDEELQAAFVASMAAHHNGAAPDKP